ncbi:unnamed protein product [Somion occarium]|uniref:Uncharacterized protein n=1 Tax=Somion occarium TaxID=3059160 RepID=A0ABP1CQD3_9APHY
MNPAPAANLYHADQNFQQSIGTMTGNVAGPAPAPGTGAAVGIGTGTRQVDNNYANTGASVGTVAPVGTMNAKPSMGSRVIGEAEKMAGELTGNPKLVERGELKKAFHQCSA